MTKEPKRGIARDDHTPAPAPQQAVDSARFESAFCHLVAYERPRQLQRILEQAQDVLRCGSAQFLAQTEVVMTSEHPSFRQAARCAAILAGIPASQIGCVALVPSGDQMEVSIAMRGSSRWDRNVPTDLDRLAEAWLEARGE